MIGQSSPLASFASLAVDERKFSTFREKRGLRKRERESYRFNLSYDDQVLLT